MSKYDRILLLHHTSPTEFALFCVKNYYQISFELKLIVKSAVGKEIFQCHLKESEIVKGFK